MTAAVWIVLAALGASAPPAAPQAGGEVIAEIRVHGNHIASNDEVIAGSGIILGAPFGPATLADAHARLKATRRYVDVELLKRFASIVDPTRIVVVIIVSEGPVRLVMPGGDAPALVVRRRGLRNLMWAPILDAEDGYGLTYGARIARVDIAGDRSRLSFPLTWGGLRQAGVELDRTWDTGIVSRAIVGAAVRRQRNPAFDEEDDRRRIWARVERNVSRVRAGLTAGWQDVSFGTADDTIRSIGADVTFDTRINPLMPRNAVYASAAVERLLFSFGGDVRRTRLDGRAYIGLIGQTTLEIRAVREDASRPLPLYLKSLLGGWSSLRGFRAGSFVGDTLVSGSVELRVPLTSTLSIGKIGVSAFIDSGQAYDKGRKFDSGRLRTGIGGSVWFTAAVFQMSLGVAHGRGADTRVNFGGGFVF